MSQPDVDTEVLIVGAGPTGLLLANLLGGMGRRVIIVDRNATTVQQPRAVSIDDESMRALQATGTAETVEAVAACGYGSIYRGPSGRIFAKVMPRECEYGWEKRNAFEQPVLEDILRKALERFPDVEVSFSTEMTECLQHDGIVTATLVGLGTRRTLSARYLIGCDGARSDVRKQIGVKLKGSSFEELWLIVDLARTLNRCRHTEVSCNPARPFITLPGPGGIRRYEFKLMRGETAESVSDHETARRLLSEAGRDGEMPMKRVQVYSFHARIADLWRRGRILIAGDAAHLTPPFAGQGMNSGLRDAHNLAWKLDEALRAEAIGVEADALLDSYQVERRPHALEMIRLAQAMGRVMMPRSSLQALVTRAFFRAIAISPAARDYVAGMRFKPKPCFRDGLIWPPGGGNPRSPIGRMFPQPQVEDADRVRRRLDNVLPDAPVVLVFDRTPEKSLPRFVFDALCAVGASVVGIVPEDTNPVPSFFPVFRDASWGLSGAGYQVCLGSAFLLRRDRYVAAIRPIAQAEALIEFVKRLSPGRNADKGAKLDGDPLAHDELFRHVDRVAN